MNVAADEKPERSPLWLRALPPLFAVVGSSVCVVFALRLWNAHLGIPFEYGGDSLSHAMHLEQLVQNGWVWSDDRLGVPFGQHMQDWPIGDVLSLLTGWVLALFTNNWAVVQNGIFLLSFPLTALSAWWALHRLGLHSWTASVMGILFSLLPYHFVRGESHLFLSNYYVVPLGIYLAMRLLDSDSLFSTGSRFSSRWLRYASPRTAQTLLLALLIGLGGIYYAAFTVLFVVTALVVRIFRSQSVFPPIVIVAAIVGGVVLATAPTMLYQLQHGPNTEAADRQAYESDVYGLKLAQMLAPAPGHRIDAFDDYQNDYLNEFPLPAERGSAALGAVASVGLLMMLGLTIASLIRRTPPSDNESRMRQFSLFAIVGFLVASIGGFSTPIGLLLIDSIRSWNRMSVAIAVCAFAVAGLAIDGLLKRVKARRAPVVAAVLGAVLLVGYLDQVTPTWTPAYASVDARFLEDQKYFGAIESRMGDNASVYVLPHVEFPESPKVGNVDANDPLVPYLQTDTMKWSFGGLKGRLESSWQERIRPAPADLVTDVVAAGFQGLLIDRDGYDDAASALESELSGVLGGATPTVNRDGNYAFFDLRDISAELQQREGTVLAQRKAELLYPAGVVNVRGFFGRESDDQSSWNWAVGNHGDVIIENTTDDVMRSEISLELETATGSPSQFFITWPDGSSQTVEAGQGSVTLTHVVDLEPGATRVDVRSNAAPLPAGTDTRDLRFRLLDADVVSAS
jgi:hypothetical protein